MRFRRFEKTVIQKENEKKFNIIMGVWFLPAVVILFLDYKTLSFPTFELLHQIPSFDAYVNATKYKILANIVWTYFWATSPFVLVLQFYCCYSVPMGVAHSTRGAFSVFVLILATYFLFFLQFGSYDPNATGYGYLSRFYRNTELGVVVIAFAAFVAFFAGLTMFLQWLAWAVKRLFN